MARNITFVLVALLLLAAVTSTIRTEPADPVKRTVEDMGQKDQTPQTDQRLVEGCEGVGEQECLMRRTLAAHTDYIYTQEHHN